VIVSSLTENNGKSKRNSKISEWLKPEAEIIEAEESNNTKYLIIAAMLILAGLSWYYSDEIKTGGISLIEWIRSFRPRPDGDSNNVGDTIRTDSAKDLKTRLKGLFDKEKHPANSLGSLDNSSQITIKGNDLENVASSSKIKLEDVEPIHVQVTGLSEIRSDNFEESTSAVLGEIDHYFKNVEDGRFPKILIQQGLFEVVRKRLVKLSQVNEQKYDQLLKMPMVKVELKDFLIMKKNYIQLKFMMMLPKLLNKNKMYGQIEVQHHLKCYHLFKKVLVKLCLQIWPLMLLMINKYKIIEEHYLQFKKN